MKNAPCGKCPKKGCGSYHSICPEYVEWRTMQDAQLDAKFKTQHLREYAYETTDKKKAIQRKKKKR